MIIWQKIRILKVFGIFLYLLKVTQSERFSGESEDLITPSGGNNETIEDSGPTLSPQDGWPKDKNENLEEKFLVKMPPDFFTFWGFCTLMNRSNPLRAIFDTAGLKLVGPFELLLEAKVTQKA